LAGAVALPPERARPAGINLEGRGIEPDRLIVVRDRAIEIALGRVGVAAAVKGARVGRTDPDRKIVVGERAVVVLRPRISHRAIRSEEHTSELQSQSNLVCRLPPGKKKSW